MVSTLIIGTESFLSLLRIEKPNHRNYYEKIFGKHVHGGENDMRANFQSNSLSDDERGLVGIGTLIIFIALILVASVAAGVIIRTSGALREQARKTGEEAIREVSNGLKVIDTKGYIKNENEIDNVQIVVSLRAGSSGINFKDVAIQYMSESSGVTRILQLKNHYFANSGIAPENHGNANRLQDNEYNVVKINQDGDTYMLGKTGSKASIWINTDIIENEGPSNLTADEEVKLTLMPQVGIDTQLTLLVPPALEDTKVTKL